MSEYIEFATELDIQPIIDEFVNRINRYIDEATLAKVERQLEEYGYVKVIRCRDCKYCEPIRSRRIDGLKCVANSESVSVEPDGFCAWAERKEVAE